MRNLQFFPRSLRISFDQAVEFPRMLFVIKVRKQEFRYFNMGISQLDIFCDIFLKYNFVCLIEDEHREVSFVLKIKNLYFQCYKKYTVN